jgi:hypothetical protein
MSTARCVASSPATRVAPDAGLEDAPATREHNGASAPNVACPWESVGTRLSGDGSAARERGRKLLAGAEHEFAEDAREMTFHRACGDE